ncbi:hypothetical protein JCM8547_005864 [Rhodosporidiobolus lusitaniae]
MGGLGLTIEAKQALRTAYENRDFLPANPSLMGALAKEVKRRTGEQYDNRQINAALRIMDGKDGFRFQATRQQQPRAPHLSRHAKAMLEEGFRQNQHLTEHAELIPAIVNYVRSHTNPPETPTYSQVVKPLRDWRRAALPAQEDGTPARLVGGPAGVDTNTKAVIRRGYEAGHTTLTQLVQYVKNNTNPPENLTNEQVRRVLRTLHGKEGFVYEEVGRHPKNQHLARARNAGEPSPRVLNSPTPMGPPSTYGEDDYDPYHPGPGAPGPSGYETPQSPNVAMSPMVPATPYPYLPAPTPLPDPNDHHFHSQHLVYYDPDWNQIDPSTVHEDDFGRLWTEDGKAVTAYDPHEGQGY